MKKPNLGNLTRVFQKYPEIQAVYLFGSTASGKTHFESDLDLAIAPLAKGLSKKRLQILADLAQEGYCNVDLVFLEGDDIILQYEAVRQNRIIYQVPSFERGTTYSQVVRKYLDFYPYLKVQREAYKKRILDDSAGSSA